MPSRTMLWTFVKDGGAKNVPASSRLKGSMAEWLSA